MIDGKKQEILPTNHKNDSACLHPLSTPSICPYFD